MNNIISQLVALRKERGYSQRTLAEMTDLSYVHIAKIETEKTSPSLDTLLKIAEALEAEIKLIVKHS